MHRLVVALLAVPGFAFAQTAEVHLIPNAEVEVEDEATPRFDAPRTEVLGTPVRVGERVDLPEGWYRVEEAGDEDRRVGSFTVVPAAVMQRLAARLDPGETVEEPAAPVDDPCRAERNAYLRELLEQEGIEVDDPVGLMEGLEGTAFAPGFNWYWLALRTDPIRPLAWNSDLRRRAKDLARCTSGG